ncbi:MAG TPA: HD domain-containing phosphohydrolase, partial [Gemmatimonadaceae bacterium]|nr:HD domain-containing phosphohydrolase [Gemmatimonadaceae bacterium]
ILAPLQHLGKALRFVQDHHEHFDGSGYPQAIAGEKISVGGRILAAADAFDALTSRRAYRDPLTPEDTVELLRAQIGRLLDPAVFAALEAIVSRRKTLVFIDDLHG